ncbi:MAG TPA: hypothetical protein VKY85_07715 [Candidatus Angelobacter sp.]|nr:hypothetical protein [Candidatus Angelobacter sp.]
MSRNQNPRKTCLLSRDEYEALVRRNIRPDCSLGLHAHLSMVERADMLLTGEIELISHHFASYGTYARRVKGGKLKPSSATIKRTEVEANAGTMGRSRTGRLSALAKDLLERQGQPTEDFIERAQQKIRMWPFVGDTKAVRVGPLGVENASGSSRW